MKRKICVLGLGYIGLPTALLFAKNYPVTGVDINERIVSALNRGSIPFQENGLTELFHEVKHNFTAKTEVPESDVFLIAVPTPLEKSVKVSDLAYVRAATEMIVPHLKKGDLVILESTVPPGTSNKLLIPILERSGVKRGEFFFVHCPERAIPGNTLNEMITNNRIIGGNDEKSVQMAKELYATYVKGGLFLTDTTTAEFVKLMENTFRDINIALANDFAIAAENNKIDIWEAIDLANKHPRVNILRPGPGVGGHCIAVDPWFIAENSPQSKMISLAREINDNMPNHVLQLVRQCIEGQKDPLVTILGVSYKGNVDDTRETPALKFIKLAENEGYKIKIFDPLVKKFEYPLSSTLQEALENSDCIVLITDHSIFRDIDPVDAKQNMRSLHIVDTRNVICRVPWESAGFHVKIIGNGKPT